MCTLFSSFRNSIYTSLPFMNNSSVNVHLWLGTVRIENNTISVGILLELKGERKGKSFVGCKIMFYVECQSCDIIL